MLARGRALMRAMATKACIEAEYGIQENALTACLTGFRLGRMLENEPTLIGQVVRVAMDGIAAWSLEDLFGKADGSKAVLQALVDEIGRERREATIWAGVRGEVGFVRSWFDAQFRKKGEQVFEFTQEDRQRLDELSKGLAAVNADPDTIKKIEEAERKQKEELKAAYVASGCKDVEAFFDAGELYYLQVVSKIAPLLQKPFWEVRDELARVESDVRAAPLRVAYVARMSGTAGSWARTALQEARMDAWLGAGELALADQLYRQEHGAYADKLEQLTPGILKELPLDPFTGKSFIYRREGKGFVVYSVGEDLKDDGGVEERALKPDIVWRCTN